MFRTPILALVVLCLAAPVAAADSLAYGSFKAINTGGFVQSGETRKPLDQDTGVGTARIEPSDTGGLTLTVNGALIELFRLEGGLAALEWDAGGTVLLHSIDIQALFGKGEAADVPAWGAALEWPGMGPVQFVVLPLGATAYTGFLISRPGNSTVVRQMEFRKIIGPSNRPARPGPKGMETPAGG